MELRAGRLAQHSMHVVDSESCDAKLADNMATIGASKGGSAADDDGRVATYWRPSGTCTSRSFAAARSAGGPGGTDELETAWGTLELRFERGSNVARQPSACGRKRLVAELLLGSQSPCMLCPGASLWRSVPHSGRLDCPPWVPTKVSLGGSG